MVVNQSEGVRKSIPGGGAVYVEPEWGESLEFIGTVRVNEVAIQQASGR